MPTEGMTATEAGPARRESVARGPADPPARMSDAAAIECTCVYCGARIRRADGRAGRRPLTCKRIECRRALGRENDRARRRRERRNWLGIPLPPGVCTRCCHEVATCVCYGVPRDPRVAS